MLNSPPNSSANSPSPTPTTSFPTNVRLSVRELPSFAAHVHNIVLNNTTNNTTNDPAGPYDHDERSIAIATELASKMKEDENMRIRGQSRENPIDLENLDLIIKTEDQEEIKLDARMNDVVSIKSDDEERKPDVSDDTWWQLEILVAEFECHTSILPVRLASDEDKVLAIRPCFTHLTNISSSERHAVGDEKGGRALRIRKHVEHLAGIVKMFEDSTARANLHGHSK